MVFGDSEARRVGDGAKIESWVKTWIRETIAGYTHDKCGMWAIELIDEEKSVGYCGFKRSPDLNGRKGIELG